jgi:hypothetical protein
MLAIVLWYHMKYMLMMLQNLSRFLRTKSAERKVELSESEQKSKLNYCFYCDNEYTNIQGHWFSQHRREQEVMQILCQKTVSGRLRNIMKLKLLGNNLHNLVVDSQFQQASYTDNVHDKTIDSKSETTDLNVQCTDNGQQLDSSTSEAEEHSGANDESESTSCIQVLQQKVGVSWFDKKPYCFFCGIQQAQLQRHWITKHSAESAVIAITGSSDKADRLRQITKLRNLGNHLHNIGCLREGKGEILVTYRPKGGYAKAYDYAPCERCFSYLIKGDIYRHKCKFGTDNKKGRVASSSSLLLPPPPGVSVQLNEILNGMKDVGVKLVAKTDSLIGDYAAKLIAKKGMTKKLYIRDKIREVARFLIEMRKQDALSHATLTQCITPQCFRRCVQAVKSLAGFSDVSTSYSRPSLALKIGHALQKLAKLVKRNSIENSVADGIAAADHFSELCSMEWGDEIAHSARLTLQDRKENKIKLLPLTSDVIKLNKYLCDISDESMDKLINVESRCGIEITWRELAEATLSHIITFNRRRQGEVSKMTLLQYNSRTSVNLTSDVNDALSPVEQNLCKLFTRVELKGKRDRIVPVLLTSRAQSAMDMLIRFRDQAGVRTDNNYVFAYSHSNNYLRGCDALRNASKKCGAEHPETLRSTNFRKHVATLSQVLNLKNNELDMLAQFMGHSIDVHRKFYRLPDDVIQTSQLAKIFMLMDNGQLAQQKGKSLDEIILTIDSNDFVLGK